MLEIQNKTIHISYHAIRQNTNNNYTKHIKMSSDHKLDLLKKTSQDIIQDIKLNTFKSKLTKELTSKNMILLRGKKCQKQEPCILPPPPPPLAFKLL